MISIIIPTLNEEDYVGGLLADLTSQSYGDFEVIISDSSSDDKTANVVGSFADKLNLKTTVVERKNPATGRNGGAKIASGEWLLFLDADVRIGSDFLEKLIRETEEREFDVASAYVAPISKKLIDKIGSWIILRYMMLFSRTNAPMAGGYCIFIKKSIHELIGGFDIELKLGEDHEYLARAVASGARFGYVKGAVLKLSMRRFEKYGRLKMFSKYALVDLYRLTHSNKIDKEIVKYKFGNNDKKQNSKS